LRSSADKFRHIHRQNPALQGIKMAPPISFFLPGPAGNLFAMYYPPAETDIDNGDIIYVHPFAGEMFASRNLIAALAREMASEGFGVLMVDLYGCGDSSGDFGDARWEIWRDDLVAAAGWLRAQGRDRLSLWGLRLGALLAMDFAARSGETYERIVLWQPVVTGRNMLTQFFRMNLDEAEPGLPPGQLTDPEARKSLADGLNIEIAGYELSPDLIREIDKLEIAALGKAVSGPIHWMQVSDRVENPFHPETLRVLEDWKQQRVRVTAHKCVAPPFWLFPHSAEPARLADGLAVMFRNPHGTGTGGNPK
jgi:exosortase A-associated hydrolase 2